MQVQKQGGIVSNVRMISGRKASMANEIGHTAKKEQDSTNGSTQHAQSDMTGMTPACATNRASGNNTPLCNGGCYEDRTWGACRNYAAACRLPVHARVTRERIASLGICLTNMVEHQAFKRSWLQNTAPVLHFVAVQPRGSASQHLCGDLKPSSPARVSVV